MARTNTGNFEQYGLEAVPSSLKISTWKEYAIITFAFSVNAGNFLVPALAVTQGNLPWLAAFLAVWIGALLAFLCVSALSIPGALYGLPGQYILRTFVGSWLATKIASPIRVLTSLYWFSVQTIGGTFILQAVISIFVDIHIPFAVLASLTASLMAYLALVGYDAVKKVTRLFLPLLIIGQGLMLFVIFKEMSAVNAISTSNSSMHWGVFFFYMSLAFVQFVSGVSASSDMTRYAKTARQGFVGMFVGNTAGYFMTALIGTLVAAYFHSTNPFVTLSDQAPSFYVGLFITFSGLLAMISINIGNAYTGGFSLLNTWPSLGRIKSALLFGGTGVFLSCFPRLSAEAAAIISLLGAGIVPLSAIIVIDYLWFKRGTISEEDLLQVVSGSYKINLAAIITFVTMSIAYLIIPKELSPGMLVFIVSSIVYLVLKKFHVTKLTFLNGNLS
ncbi:cytosine permease [Paenisporosarcina quisquiliarum]|uniref:Cytosine permease n=1 Tax=Paenisporosarcina quisquiliarum TaxID=365346 RepID=A0A9X3RDE1_9BACL|nr:cytosine permease [Paenisporosarcina quisquiliarum]MCZ8536282.1 cytosine permease [Paenisporosarcina quisquiliarum]